MAHGGSFSMAGYPNMSNNQYTSDDLPFDMKSMSLQGSGGGGGGGGNLHMQNVFHANSGNRGAAAVGGPPPRPSDNISTDQFLSMLGLAAPPQQQQQAAQFGQFGMQQQQQQQQQQAHRFHPQQHYGQFPGGPYNQQLQMNRSSPLMQQAFPAMMQQQQQQQQSRVARQAPAASPGAPIQRAPGAPLPPPTASTSPGVALAPGSAAATPPAASTPPSSTTLSVNASEFVPVFRKPEKKLVLYSLENFKRKSNADDAMGINQVKKKLVDLLKSPPRNIEEVMAPVVETIKAWSTSVLTFHQIVEDVFEFSVDDNNRLANNASFIPIGSKVLNYLVKTVTPIEGNTSVTFFDTLVHKCCREFDNCIKLDHNVPANANRIRNVALIIGELFNTIKEGEMRVYLFAEQVTSLCLILVQVRTSPAFEAVAKVFLTCGCDLRCLVDEVRFNCIVQHLQNASKLPQLDLGSKTKAMLEDVVALNAHGWKQPDQEEGPGNSKLQKSWSTGSDDCAPVTNPGDWNDYATDEYDEDMLAQMLKLEEEDDFSDYEEDFEKFMEEAARKFKN